MNYVKIGLEEYDRLKKSHDALRAKKILKVRSVFQYGHYEEYFTESEVISKLTDEINELQLVIDKLKSEANMVKVEVKKNSLWDFLKKTFK